MSQGTTEYDAIAKSPWASRFKESAYVNQINDLLAKVAELEARKTHVDAEATRICVERDRFRNCLEYIATECDYEETVPTKRWLQQVAADALDPDVDHHD